MGCPHCGFIPEMYFGTWITCNCSKNAPRESARIVTYEQDGD